jgi:oxygen-independent coproporphyrinogen-3 oxidase
MRAGIYIHIPFCVRKCHYCDFYSLPVSEENGPREEPHDPADTARRQTPSRIEAFTAALCREIEMTAEAHSVQVPFEAPTLFFGGGTPSLVPVAQLARMLECVRRHFRLAPDAEITLEANPESITPEKARAYRELGINRVSLGVQSFDDRLLARLGRVHSARRAVDAFETLRAAGFDNLSLDLMFALPGQTLADWQATLAQAIALRPEHISAYSLIIEDGTPFAEWQRTGVLGTPGEDVDVEMLETGVATLSAAGYEHYEISNFALPGRRCAHNEIYWRNEPYFGFGPSAVGYLEGARAANVRSLEGYLAALAAGKLPVESSEMPSRDLEMGETMMVGLRLLEGVEHARFRERFGADPRDVYAGPIEKMEAAGLLCVDETRLALTHQGFLFANDVAAAFLPD